METSLPGILLPWASYKQCVFCLWQDFGALAAKTLCVWLPYFGWYGDGDQGSVVSHHGNSMYPRQQLDQQHLQKSFC